MLPSAVIFFPLSLLLLFLHFSSLQLLSSEYTQPDKHFIACGSKSNTTVPDGRIFVGDWDHPPFSLSPGQSKCITDSNRSNDKSFLYRTARIFQNPSWYELEVAQNGTYMVRLHFYSFSSPTNLSAAVFDVLASGYSLLSDFSVRKSSTLLIEEFILAINTRKFGLYFRPSQSSRLAFVNAIEVFLVPDNFIPNSAPQVKTTGPNGNLSQLLSLVFRTVHRINVGGVKITPETDTLWRTWIPDDDYLINPEAAKKSDFFDASIKFEDEGVTKYIAPDYVYQTAKELNLSSSKQASFSNVTWAFPVSENVAKHLVRVHFCDIIGPAINIFDFSLFIYNKFQRKINSYKDVGELAAPFYFDFVVDSNGSRYINISMVPLPENSSGSPNAFLNGVEIFEIQRKSGPVPFESRPKKEKSGLLIGLGVAFAVFLGMLISVFLVFTRGKGKLERASGGLLYGGLSSQEILAERTAIAPNLNLSLKISFADIQSATSNFDVKMLIGEGGFGKVYKGTLKAKGIKVAVKRSQPGLDQGLLEFHTEILVLSQIRHRHLVSLIGYCDERSEMILVYEFMENGTLRDHLYDSMSESPRSSTEFKLSWEKRLEICIGAAKGLHYLHTGSAEEIIHRDVKSTNILLDENFVAKVADFGLSKSGPTDPNNESMVLKGSFGYLDPEYIRSSQYTVKSDVYSFGVVLLEVLCAKPAIFTLPQEEEKVSLAKWGMVWQRKGQLENIIDPSIASEINPNSLRVVAEIAQKCLKENGFERPKMDEVEWHLKYALQFQQNATQREPFEDITTTNTSLESAFPTVHHMPSNAFPVGEDDASVVGDGYTNTFSGRSVN
ncbi:Mitogen-activated protein kinase kinase kinase [Parasponia andersonii]|uniref:Mitogen-activated protein kinase kinase kinase n=1 Tax=Parasponia andersonii TaxID=3476 RepID=A0A2P5AFP7_PARAD|nr:Mitogen-activated protein kinase kinase kinase [Parasponia andersonii]